MGLMLLLFGVIVTSAALTRNYTSSMQLSKDGTTVHWSVSGGVLQLALVGPARGWMALGFSPSSTNAMIGNGQGADITMGYVKAGPCAAGCLGDYGQASYPSDSGSPAKKTPTLSSLVSGSLVEPAGIMTLEWDRLVSSTTVNTALPTTVIWALNPSSTAVTSDTVFQKHPIDARGSVSITFNAIGAQPNPALDVIPNLVQGSFVSPDGVWSGSWAADNVAKTISFEITILQAGEVYGAIGFNSVPSMTGADMVIGMVSASQAVTVTDRNANGHAEPALDGVQNLAAVSGFRDSSKSVFRFSRPFNTGDSNDFNLANGPVVLLWAYGNAVTASGLISQHTNRGSVLDVEFTTDCIDYGVRSGGSSVSVNTLIPVHGVLMALAFACLAPIAVVAAAGRAGLESGGVWFHLHWIAMVLCLMSSIAGFAIIFVAKSGVLTIDVHQIMGIVCFALFFVQSALGLVSHLLYDPSRSFAPVFPDLLHHWVGRVLMLFAIATLFLGIWVLQKIYGLPTLAPYGLMGAMIAVPWACYLILKIRAVSLKSKGDGGYNLGSGEDVSRSSARGDSVSKTLVILSVVASLLLFGGFCVTLYVPKFSYGGSATLALNSLTQPSKGCFRMSNLAIPSSSTSYLCRGFQFPNSPAQQAYEFQPLVDNAQVVHHMILYRTQNYVGDSVFPCTSMPSGSSPFWAWAVGGSALVTPPNTAFKAAANFALQIHYDNPSRASGLVDSSGVKVSFSPTARQYQSVYLQLGIQTGRISLPAGGLIHLSYECNSGSLIPPGAEVAIWSNGLHAHTRGRKIWIEHLRGANVVGFPGCDPFYDFNRQSFVMRNATLVRGDRLKIHCQWDLSAETQTVTGGESTSQEMCLAFLALYGRNGLALTQDVYCAGPPTQEVPIAASAVPCT